VRFSSNSSAIRYLFAVHPYIYTHADECVHISCMCMYTICIIQYTYVCIVYSEHIEFYLGGRVHGVNRNKHVMKMSGDVVGDIERFEYLRSVSQKNDCFEEDMNHNIKCVGGWSGEKRQIFRVIRRSQLG